MKKIQYNGDGIAFTFDDEQPIHLVRNDRETLCGLPLDQEDTHGHHQEVAGLVSCSACQNIIVFCRQLPAEETAHFLTFNQ